MTEKLCFVSCRNFHEEIAAAIKEEAWDDVVSIAFPARCGRPPLSWEELRSRLPEECGQLVLLGRVCLNGLPEPPCDFPAVRTVVLEQCFHLVAGQAIVTEAMTNGGYLITPIWLANWRERLNEMGFSSEQAGEFFHDFAKELVFLDTGVDPNAVLHLAELGETINLPARRIAVGLDYTRLLLTRWVLEWRLEQGRVASKKQQRQSVSELANYVSAMDMLARLAKTEREIDVIAAIEDLFQMLFAPEALYYLRVENHIPLTNNQIPPDVLKTLLGLQNDYAWTADERGFLLRIGRGEDILGLIAVERLTFPEYRSRYLNMALNLTGVCGLAIENARNRRRLLEAEKMASLGILVAGVAHEINTPLGVGLAAATTLQDQSLHLARCFAERSMTQSDLKYYLELAETTTRLIRDNLERIGHLIDTFRQVAVNDKPLEKKVFRLKNCINDVIRSLGDRLPSERIAVRIQCDSNLEIQSWLDDWVSIFINLIANSLKHGFKNRERGAIDILITSDMKKLYIDYHDDGVGLTPEVLARIFDPFFTTDLQHGMGLGMHLVYNLVNHRLGGTIQCDSQPEQGTHFHIEVPR